jgi:hypothetical protein
LLAIAGLLPEREAGKDVGLMEMKSIGRKVSAHGSY